MSQATPVLGVGRKHPQFSFAKDNKARTEAMYTGYTRRITHQIEALYKALLQVHNLILQYGKSKIPPTQEEWLCALWITFQYEIRKTMGALVGHPGSYNQRSSATQIVIIPLNDQVKPILPWLTGSR